MLVTHFSQFPGLHMSNSLLLVKTWHLAQKKLGD